METPTVGDVRSRSRTARDPIACPIEERPAASVLGSDASR
jgi:hypothetical protein